MGLTGVLTKHLLFDAAVDWLFTDIPNQNLSLYVGGFKLSLKFGYAF